MSTVNAPKPRVLVVDDEENISFLVGAALRLQGCTVESAATGAAALAAAATLDPQVVVLDIQLPDLDGYEVLRRLRADPVTASVPVIAISANAMPDDIARGHAAGFDEYLAKPLELPLLLQTLARVLVAGRRGIS